MKKICTTITTLSIVFCFGQANWQYEIIDSVSGAGSHFTFNDIDVDSNGIPCVVYDRNSFHDLMLACRVDSIWQIEVVESSDFYYGMSIALDNNNGCHLGYYRKDTISGISHLVYAYKDTSSWVFDLIDSCVSPIGNYYLEHKSSIAIDTFGYPAIAYLTWEETDSIHPLKFAHYNGVSWDITTVEYDSAYSGNQIAPTDFSPSLKFKSDNIPFVAYYHVYPSTMSDTLKLAHYVDSLGQWVKDTVACDIYGGVPVSLDFNNQNQPSIAHINNSTLVYTWWDNSNWTSDFIDGIGTLHTRISLSIDTDNNPHIVYLLWGFYSPKYCYRDTIWHICDTIEPDTAYITFDKDVSLVTDSEKTSHIVYPFDDFGSSLCGLKYVHGSIVGIEESRMHSIGDSRNFYVYPSVTSGYVTIGYSVENIGLHRITLYDITGRKIESLPLGHQSIGLYTEHIDMSHLDAGVYFIQCFSKDSDGFTKIILVN